MVIIFWLAVYGYTLAPLANATKPFVCGGNTVLCQITLTTCYLILMIIFFIENFKQHF